jgi:hypothetical protein
MVSLLKGGNGPDELIPALIEAPMTFECFGTHLSGVLGRFLSLT